MSTQPLRPLPVAAALLFAACAAPLPPPVPAGAFAPLAPGDFPAAAALLTGFDDRSDASPWLAGDRALFALQLDGDDEPVRWLLLVEVTRGERVRLRDADGNERDLTVGMRVTWPVVVDGPDGPRELPIRTGLVDVRVRVFSATGDLVTDTRESLPSDLLGRGLLPAVERALQPGADGQPPPFDRPEVEGYFAVRQLLEIVRGNDQLADYFWRVVEKPSLWSVLTSFGVGISTAVPLHESVPIALPPGLPGAERCFAVPMRIDVNGTPALFVDLVATDSRRPFALCGGIVAATARHPSRAARTFRLQLFAARHGSIRRGTTTIDLRNSRSTR